MFIELTSYGKKRMHNVFNIYEFFPEIKDGKPCTRVLTRSGHFDVEESYEFIKHLIEIATKVEVV